MSTAPPHTPPPRPPLAVSRRRVLTGTAVTVGAALTVGLAGCDETATDRGAGPLGALAEAAADDARVFGSASAALGDDAQRIRAAGALRAEHARRLETEIARTGGTAPSTSVAPAPGEGVCPPLATVRDRVRAAARSAADAVADLEGFPAALVASVAAGCTAAAEVALA